MPTADGGPGLDGPDLLGLADRFWRWQDALAGGAPDGTLSSAADEIEVVLATSDRDDLLLAILQARRNESTDLEILGSGVFDDLAYDGDPEALARMGHYGVPAPTVAAISQSMTR